MNTGDSSFDEHSMSLVFFSNSEKALFSFLIEIFDYNNEAFMSALVISFEVLFDIHIENTTRKKYLTETLFDLKKKNLITILDDSRWDAFEYPFEKWGAELGFSDYSFKLLNQIKTLGGYRNYRETLLVAMRLLCVLSVQSARHRSVNVFRKIYNTEVRFYEKSTKFVYEDLTKEIKGMVTFH